MCTHAKIISVPKANFDYIKWDCLPTSQDTGGGDVVWDVSRVWAHALQHSTTQQLACLWVVLQSNIFSIHVDLCNAHSPALCWRTGHVVDRQAARASFVFPFLASASCGCCVHVLEVRRCAGRGWETAATSVPPPASFANVAHCLTKSVHVFLRECALACVR